MSGSRKKKTTLCEYKLDVILYSNIDDNDIFRRCSRLTINITFLILVCKAFGQFFGNIIRLL